MMHVYQIKLLKKELYLQVRDGFKIQTFTNCTATYGFEIDVLFSVINGKYESKI